MDLLPVLEHFEENTEFTSNPICSETIQMTIDFYKKIGFKPPWIGYYVKENGNLVGAAGFYGKPIDGKVEIAYGTFEIYQNLGFGTKICKLLVELTLKTDPSLRITARTLAENNYSTRILKKNGFEFSGNVYDPEDGDLWEWEYVKFPK